jgi:DHA1 family bicyclomycin/chloramphenicol resistance-like MFS transporter
VRPVPPQTSMAGAPTEAKLDGGILFTLAALSALGALATNIILPAFPQMSIDLGVSSRSLGLTLSSFFIAFALGQLLVGPLSDRFGRRTLVLGGLVVFVGGSIVCAMAPSLPVLVSGRIVQALGACAASVSSRAIARDLFDSEPLARALAFIMVAGAAAPGFSPLLGSGLEVIVGWRATFLIVAAASVALAIFYASGTGETLPVERRNAVSLSATGRAYADLALDPRFILPALAVSFIIGSLYTFFAAAPSLMMDQFGLTGLQLGLYFAATVLIVFAAGFLAPRLARRWGPKPVAMAGLGIAIAGAFSLFWVATAPGLGSHTAALGLFLLGMGLVNPLGTAIALGPFGHQAGLASALLGFLQMACAAIGAALASVLPLTPFLSLAVVMSAGAALAVIIFAPVVLRPSRAGRPRTAPEPASEPS